MEPILSIDPALSREKTQRCVAAFLATAGSHAAMIEARMMLCAALNIDHAALLREPERLIGSEVEKVRDFALRRARHEPLSRILGHREFFGLDFSIDTAVLDPRADTETLVEAAIERMAGRRDTALQILDLGIGSGAILCALLAHFPNAFGIGIDVSEAACRIAVKNLTSLGLGSRGKIVCGDWTKAVSGSFDVIVSNPPYIARAEIATLDPEVRDYDPPLALDGGDDGYAAYRAIIPALPGLFARDGAAAFEIGIGQAKDVGDLFKAAGLTVMRTKRDLAGIERAIVARVVAEPTG